MAYVPETDIGAWMDVEGVDPLGMDPPWVEGVGSDGPLPAAPIYTRVEGPWGVPWFDGYEVPNIASELPLLSSMDPLPFTPNEDVGALPKVGAFEGAFRTRGPVSFNWGLEASGGMYDTPAGIQMGDQMVGRIMRFPANIPDRYDRDGVFSGNDYRDELAALIANGDVPIKSDAEVTTNLVNWPNVWDH